MAQGSSTGKRPLVHTLASVAQAAPHLQRRHCLRNPRPASVRRGSRCRWTSLTVMASQPVHWPAAPGWTRSSTGGPATVVFVADGLPASWLMTTGERRNGHRTVLGHYSGGIDLSCSTI